MIQNLNDHMEKFAQIMISRGYDGHFLSNADHPGKLRESLTKHVVESLQSEGHLRPFFLTTYSSWKDDKSPYVQCNFKVKYNQSEGFVAEKLDINHDSPTGRIKSVTISLNGNKDIPYREHANGMVVGARKRLKLRQI